MDVELLVIVLAVVLPLYPSLFVIYEKIGKYEVFCAEFEAHREEQKLKEANYGSRINECN
ncbi:MAG: hypothetical protein WCJ93_04805 [Methanomicrobiales archaeon]